MCAIVDASVIAEVFGEDRSGAGDMLRTWIDSGRIKLVAGGQLRRELNRSTSKFVPWFTEAARSSKLTFVNDQSVDDMTRVLRRSRECRSNDPHVIALAHVSGSRLLYTRDKDLMGDFKSKSILDDPRGKIFPLGNDANARSARLKLLRSRRICSYG